MFALLLKIGIPQKWAARLATPLLILAIVMIVAPLSYCKGRSDGVNGERIKHERALREALEDLRTREAGANDAATAGEGEAAEKIEIRREEIDDAIANIPTIGLDERRLRIACIELRRASPDIAAAAAECRDIGA